MWTVQVAIEQLQSELTASRKEEAVLREEAQRVRVVQLCAFTRCAGLGSVHACNCSSPPGMHRLLPACFQQG